MEKLLKVGFVIAALLVGRSEARAQTDQVDLYELSFEELMNISVVSASNEKERLRDAPVTIYTISREEISRAGILSIPEAMRLVPGVIVRETTNGNYDIHLRGFDNTPQYTSTADKINALTLVMINNRPVFNYNVGGTFWEALPVDIADVDRIEVVLGPSAPLFGPNAVSGVINIITRSYAQDKLLVSGQLVGSMPGSSAIGNLAIGKSINEKLSLGVSANYQERKRLDDLHYVYGNMDVMPYYQSSQEFRKAEVEQKELDHEQSLLRQGVNAYASYQMAEDIRLDISTGWQTAEAQKVLLTAATPLTYSESSSLYGNVGAKVRNLNMRFSYLQGEDELDKLSQGFTSAYEYQVIEGTADYDLKLSSKLRLRPSVHYQTSTYSDEDKITAATPLGGLLNAKQSLNLAAASLRADYTMLEGLRLVGSGRIDKFDIRDASSISYQFAATYALGSSWTLRALHGTSYSGMFYNHAFVDATLPVAQNAFIHVTGNQQIALAHNTLSEIGARVQLKENLQADLTLFMQKLEDVAAPVQVGQQTTPMGIVGLIQYRALPFTAHQQGASLSLKWMPSKQWQIQPFVTLQKTELQNFDYYNNPAYDGKTVKHNSTPAVFGGWYINWAPTSRFNFNTSAYVMGSHYIHHQKDLTYPNQEGEMQERLLLNAKASYQLVDKLNLLVGAKNLLNQNKREHYATDRMGRQFFGGISYNF